MFMMLNYGPTSLQFIVVASCGLCGQKVVQVPYPE